jgi:hemoglobin/transferrin/lactoferrin receptor protein
MPEEFSFGPFLSSRRDFVDVDQIERLEIARGPVSTLYGSDALGGVVAITTRAPNDYVSADDPLRMDIKSGYSSADDSWVNSLNAAAGNETFAGLITYSHRSGEETETRGRMGGTGLEREAADPQSITTQSLGAKVAWSPADGHNLIFGIDALTGETSTNLLSDADVVTRGVLTTARFAEDSRDRERFSLSYRYAGKGLVSTATATLYQQDSKTRQITMDERVNRGAAQSRLRESLFDQEIAGLFAQASSNFVVANSQHTLTYGVDVYRTQNNSLRVGGTTDLASGAPVREFLPLPTRDFPFTRVENRALFLQDEIELLDGRLRLTPGLRYDDYEALTRGDEIYFNGNPGVGEPADFADSALTLKLGGLYHLTESVSAWARYSEGFRAPPYDDVNVGFSNFVGGYKTIAAPNLNAETSEGVEVGLRVNGSAGSVQLALFETRYDDFIQPLALAPGFAARGGIDPADGLQTFQSVNLDAVTIAGAELSARLALGELFSPLQSVVLEGAFAYARGEEQDGTPVETIDPMNAVLGLRWMPVSLPVEGELIWSWTDRKDTADIVSGRLPTDSFHVLDLMLHYQINPQWSLDAGVFNLTDETFIRWADTAGIGEDAPLRFSQPGRNFGITLRASL